MGMIRHQDPGKHSGVTENGVVLETAGGRAGCLKINKKTLPLHDGG
jgi:hypothetical protein